MPKTISSALNSHLQGDALTISKFLKLTLRKDQPRIEGITNANPGVVTTRWDHGYDTGDAVRIMGVRGMLEVNGGTYEITVTGPRTFSIGVSTAAFDPYTDRGEAQRVLGFTSADRPVTFENVTYEPTDAFSPSALRQSSDLSVSNLNMQGVVSSDRITDPDIAKGLYDGAEVEFFIVNRNSPGDGRMHFGPGRGNIGEVQRGRGQYEAEFRGLEHNFSQQIGHVYSQTCRADLGNDDHYMNRCYIKLRPPVWSPNVVRTLRAERDARLGSVVRTAGDDLPFHFKATAIEGSGRSAPIEPTWPTALGGTVIETPPAYAITAVTSSKFTIAGDHVVEFPAGDTLTVLGSSANDGQYTVGGTTVLTGGGDTEITVTSVIPDLTVDGTLQNDARITWTAIHSRSRDLFIESVAAGEQRYRFRINTKEPETWYRFGACTFIDGECRGLRFEIKHDSFTEYVITNVTLVPFAFVIDGDASAYFAVGDVFSVSGSTDNDGDYTVTVVSFAAGETTIEVSEDIPTDTVDGVIKWGPKIIELFLDTPVDFAAGDEIELRPGCDKTLEACKDKFDNVYNFRGEPYVPGPDRVLDTPSPKTGG